MSCFGAGVTVGLVAPDVVNAVSAGTDWDADEHFVREFIEKLGLTPEQADTMRMILAEEEQEELDHFKNYFGPQNLPGRLQRQLTETRKRADRRIHHILDEGQRKQFAELDLLDQKR